MSLTQNDFSICLFVIGNYFYSNQDIVLDIPRLAQNLIKSQRIYPNIPILEFALLAIYLSLKALYRITQGLCELLSCCCSKQDAENIPARLSLVVAENDQRRTIGEEPHYNEEVTAMMLKMARTKYNKDRHAALLVECPICYQDFQQNETIIPLPCSAGHFFHQNCIAGWLERCKRCPYCNEEISQSVKYSYRASILDKDAAIKAKKSFVDNGI